MEGIEEPGACRWRYMCSVACSVYHLRLTLGASCYTTSNCLHSKCYKLRGLQDIGPEMGWERVGGGGVVVCSCLGLYSEIYDT